MVEVSDRAAWYGIANMKSLILLKITRKNMAFWRSVAIWPVIRCERGMKGRVELHLDGFPKYETDQMQTRYRLEIVR